MENEKGKNKRNTWGLRGALQDLLVELLLVVVLF